MASNMKANETTASRIDRVATLARERRGEEDQLADVANNQANMFHRNLVNLGCKLFYKYCIERIHNLQELQIFWKILEEI
jgi:hypothetical protein